MPNARIETRRGWLGGRRADMLTAVHDAMREALKIPEWDRDLSLYELEQDCFFAPPSKGEKYTRIEITLFSGRSVDAKRALYKAIVARLGALGVEPADIKIVLIDSPAENWGIRGGQAACDVDLSFEVNV